MRIIDLKLSLTKGDNKGKNKFGAQRPHSRQRLQCFCDEQELGIDSVNLQQQEAEGSCASEGAGWSWDAVLNVWNLSQASRCKRISLMVDCATHPSNTSTSHARRTFRFLSKF